MSTSSVEAAGLGSFVDRVAALAAARRVGTATILDLPQDAMPADALATACPLLVITDAAGAVTLKPATDFTGHLRSRPVAREGTAVAQTLDSFVALVRYHSGPNSAVFVDPTWTAPAMTAVIDYHVDAVEGSDEAGDDQRARNGRHRIRYAFPLAEPWKQWLAANGKMMSQETFASFIEDHIQDVASPLDAEVADWGRSFRTTIALASDLLDLARGLEVVVNSRVKSRVRLQSGETSLVFESENKAANGAELTVPGLFVLQLPLFHRGELVRLPVRLRYRAGSDGMTWGYEIHRPELAIDVQVRSDCDTVQLRTGLPVYEGRAEMMEAS